MSGSQVDPSPASATSGGRIAHVGTYRLWVLTFLQVNTDVEALLDLDLLIKQLALALGLAMVIGNGYAIYKNRKGEKPKDEEGDFRAGRAYWLLGVGVLIALWGGISLIA